MSTAPWPSPGPSSGPAAVASAELDAVVRTEGARILATLVRTVGDLQLAEDAVQEAVMRALTDWQRSGVPAEPRAWLTVTARRAAIDVLRRERVRAGKEQDGSALIAMTAPEPPPDDLVRDDLLRLIFTCCHPALALRRSSRCAADAVPARPAAIARVLLS